MPAVSPSAEPPETGPPDALVYYEGRVVAEAALASVDALEARLAGAHEGLLAGMFVELAIAGAAPAGDRCRAVVLESSASGVRLLLEDAAPEGPGAGDGARGSAPIDP